MKSQLARLANRLAYAALLALAVFDLAILPLGIADYAMVSKVLMVANFPVSLVSLLIPADWRGLDFPLGHTAQSGARAFWNHMLIAIPVYVVLFYLLALVRRAGRRIWAQSHRLSGS